MPVDSLEYVVSSNIRLKVLSFLSNNSCTPTQLAKAFQKHLSHISRALRELESKDLVICPASQNTRPRVYYLTSEGDRLMKEILRYQARINIV